MSDHVLGAGDNLWAPFAAQVGNPRQSTATPGTLGQTVDKCGKPPVSETTADLHFCKVIHNPQPLSLRPTSYLPGEKVSAR